MGELSFEQVTRARPKAAGTYATGLKQLRDAGHLPMAIEKFDEVSVKGVTQNLFTTIEFGYSPFIPTSEQYVMDRYSAGDGSVFGPKDLKEDENWKSAVKRWQMNTATQGRMSFTRENPLDKTLPHTIMYNKSQELGVWLSRLMEQEGLDPEYATSVQEEIESQAIAKYLLNRRNIGITSNRKDIPIFKNWKKSARETFDAIGRDKLSRDGIERTLNMLSKTNLKAQLHDVYIGETTAMTDTKLYLQGESAHHTQSIEDINKIWKENLTFAYKGVFDQFDMKNKTLENIISKIPIKPDVTTSIGKAEWTRVRRNKSGEIAVKAQGDTTNYAARQMVNRFADMELNFIKGAFYVQGPVTKFHSGYAIIRPRFKRHKGERVLNDIDVYTTVVGQFGGQKGFDELVGMSEMEDYFDARGVAFKSYALNSQLILWSAWKEGQVSTTVVKNILDDANQDVANRIALQSGREDLYGMALTQYIDTAVTNSMAEATTVSVVNVLSSKDASQIIQDQLMGIAQSKNTKKEITDFYKKAVKGSFKATEAWKAGLPQASGPLNWKNQQNPQPFGPPYLGGTSKHMQGIGIPFWLTFGRDAGAFQLFRNRYDVSSKKQEKWLIQDPREAMLVMAESVKDPSQETYKDFMTGKNKTVFRTLYKGLMRRSGDDFGTFMNRMLSSRNK